MSGNFTPSFEVLFLMRMSYAAEKCSEKSASALLKARLYLRTSKGRIAFAEGSKRAESATRGMFCSASVSGTEDAEKSTKSA